MNPSTFQIVLNVRCEPIPNSDQSSLVVESATAAVASIASKFDHKKAKVEAKLQRPDLSEKKKEKLLKKLCSIVAKEQLSESEPETLSKGKEHDRGDKKGDKFEKKIAKVQAKLAREDVSDEKREKLSEKLGKLTAKSEKKDNKAEKKIAKLQTKLSTLDLEDGRRHKIASKIAKFSHTERPCNDTKKKHFRGKDVAEKIAKIEARLLESADLTDDKRQRLASKLDHLQSKKSKTDRSPRDFATRVGKKIARIQEKLQRTDLSDDKRERLVSKLAAWVSRQESDSLNGDKHRAAKLAQRKEKLLAQLAEVDQCLASLH